jgi:hypothetical protein
VHIRFQLADVLLDAFQRRVVVLGLAELAQLLGVLEPAIDRGQGLDDTFQGFLLAPELLGALGIGPDLRVLELPVDLYEAKLLAIEVKGTSSAPRTGLSGLRAWRRER